MARRKAFTLVELLVVIGIIALLVSILMPALSGAQRKAQSVRCQANLKQIGTLLLIYANENQGWMVPLGVNGRHLGAGVPREQRWPTLVFKPPVWNPPVMLCPSDVQPAEEHSYILNIYLQRYNIKFGKTKGIPSSEVIVMGEKKSNLPDYHMDPGQWDYLVEEFRHGLYVGSNYLFLDIHVESQHPKEAKKLAQTEPWDPTPTTQPNQNPPGTPD